MSKLILFRNSVCSFLGVFVWSSCSNNPAIVAHKVRTVVIKQMQFQPAELTVQPGDTVMWINRDFVDHDVTEESSKAWTSSIVPAGKSWSMVVTESSSYYCAIHQVMKGKIKLAN